MTRYQAMKDEYDRLVADGQSAVPGVREKCFRDAEELREKLDALTVEEANEEVVICL